MWFRRTYVPVFEHHGRTLMSACFSPPRSATISASPEDVILELAGGRTRRAPKVSVVGDLGPGLLSHRAEPRDRAQREAREQRMDRGRVDGL